MKKFLVLFSIMFLIFTSNRTFAQLIDEKNVTITMDLQPILQLNMSTPDQIDFVFDKISDYYSGVIKYGATILKVSSSVSWDLYAVGTSSTAQTTGVPGAFYWDYQQQYGSATSLAGIPRIPISALELHQYPANGFHAGAGAIFDYSNVFQVPTAGAPVAGQNSVYEVLNPYTAPPNTDKYIQGTKGTTLGAGGPTMGAPAGSYLTANPVLPAFSNYYFVIDYRILPGLPAIFPYAGAPAPIGAEDIVTKNAPGNYAQPGIYTMDLKFVLLEDQ